MVNRICVHSFTTVCTNVHTRPLCFYHGHTVVIQEISKSLVLSNVPGFESKLLCSHWPSGWRESLKKFESNDTQ